MRIEIKPEKGKGMRLDERLEEICNHTYATDSTQDIANWLVHKAKPYRILYDKKYGVWVIADAQTQTHADMAVDLFDSGYLYGVTNNLDNDINTMRNMGDYSSGWTDAEVYQDFGFDHYQLKGLIFIPYGLKYRDYEESGFYKYKKDILTGTIFTQKSIEFTSEGIFKSLYNKLGIMKALQPETNVDMDELWGRVFDPTNLDKSIERFTGMALKSGYDMEQITDFLNAEGVWK